MQTEKNHAGEFLLSEANGDRSREVVTIAAGHDLVAGTVLGKVTAGGEYAPYDDTETDGTETAVAILWDAVNTSATGLNAAADRLVIARDATVDMQRLTGYDAAAEPNLEAVGIIVRA